MRNPKIINYPEMKVILRKDINDDFGNQLSEIVRKTGAAYFGHNIIKNYREKGHAISAFCNYETWQDFYWDKYRNEDPLEKTIHKATQLNNLGVISWEMGHNGSLCSQDKEKITKIKDGIYFSFKRPDNRLETLAIGWENMDSEKLDTDYICYLSSLLKPIRDRHWDVQDKF